ncbi:DNA glycosylase [Rubellicoccus peritrichatus]|uniref:DNA-(apurinic or apyrimidinic site) lyase n=1 Tax=Rubellicoccus peritrichatus TaxID=3080537 RepID=A0AAQ3LBI5_9BACT|nr:DNA glycosylase [Puniceicoccus sp. CR14]WOO42696.1 DNA glycosylase [Puniceicoccus sp. CR14]
MGKSAVAWSRWSSLDLDWHPSEAVFNETLSGGQAFRWRNEGDYWEGVWASYSVRLRLTIKGVEWSAPKPSNHSRLAALKRYLSADIDFNEITDALPWRSDSNLEQALKQWSGLRILRQPFGETLLCFLCSSTKRIEQISEICERMAVSHGELIAGGRHRLPTWDEIYEAGESALRGTGMGYRARYIWQTSAFLKTHSGWLEEVESLQYEHAKSRLVELPGVGEKIADCVLLFGAGKLEAFPVDTWILKTMAKLYDLEGWKPHQVAHFGRAHFGRFAGYAQQVLFTEMRRREG